MEEEKKELSVEEATKIVVAEKEKRAGECAREISEILKKHGCEFRPLLNVVAN